MAEAKGASESDAIEALKLMLSKREANRIAERRWEARSVSSVATQEEFLEALRQTNLSAAQQSMLKTLALAGEDGLVAVSIMNAGGILIADFIGLDLPASDKDGLGTALGVLGYRSTDDTDVPLHLILHKELREAIWQTL